MDSSISLEGYFIYIFASFVHTSLCYSSTCFHLSIQQGRATCLTQTTGRKKHILTSTNLLSFCANALLNLLGGLNIYDKKCSSMPVQHGVQNGRGPLDIVLETSAGEPPGGRPPRCPGGLDRGGKDLAVGHERRRERGVGQRWRGPWWWASHRLRSEVAVLYRSCCRPPFGLTRVDGSPVYRIDVPRSTCSFEDSGVTEGDTEDDQNDNLCWTGCQNEPLNMCGRGTRTSGERGIGFPPTHNEQVEKRLVNHCSWKRTRGSGTSTLLVFPPALEAASCKAASKSWPRRCSTTRN